MKISYITNILLFISAAALSQNTIIGNFPALNNQYIKLVGFEGFNTYTIDSVKASDKGHFELSFDKNDYGMGYLAAKDNKAFIVILAPNEDLMLQGEALAMPQTVKITSGRQNLLFGRYASEHPRREQALSAWDFLARIYNLDSLFTTQKLPINAIETEKLRIKKEDDTFLASLSPETYVSWFLPVRKLVSSVSTIAQYRTSEIPAAIASFRSMNYTDSRLYKSGLLRETIEAHVWLIENSGRSLDSMFIELNISIDYMIANLIADEKKFNEITDYLFKLLESRSLFASSEYLALKVLNQASCTIKSDLASQLESYRAMKKGNIAPDFAFNDDLFAPSYQADKLPQKLSEVKSKHTLLVFGASWCPACTREISDISQLYQKWKKYGVEVVFVSLDEDKQVFKNFSGKFPFISVCDYKKWESPIVKAFHVFATPTLYLLDSKREILLRPNSANHMDSWVDWFLVQGKQ
jgi:thiol-disulfide isomerase/thioredoxin